MHLPVGPISRDEAKELVEELLRRHLDDEDMEACNKQPLKHWVVEDWVSARRSIPSREECERDDDAYLRRYGRINPAYRNVLDPSASGDLGPFYLPPQKGRRGRREEVALHRANAELLEHFPSFADHPFVFALLESLFGLDRQQRIAFERLDGVIESHSVDGEAVRHRGPREWDDSDQQRKAWALANHKSVRKRATDRLARAAAFKEWPDED